MRNFVAVTKALANPNRLKILKMLQIRSMNVGELQAALRIAQPTVSRHLSILAGAQLVEATKSGYWSHYSLSTRSSNPYASALLGNLYHWLDQDPEIKDVCRRISTREAGPESAPATAGEIPSH